MDTETLIKNNIPLIKKVATKFYNIPFEDLFQAGCIGILKAYKNYQKNGTTKFSTYAYDYILGEMYECVYKSQKIKVSKDLIRLKRKIDLTKNILSQKLNRQATKVDVANFLGLDVSLIDMAINSTNEMLSLDNPLDNEKNFYETIAIKENLSLDDKIALKESIENLNNCEKQIINYRYFKDYTQSEVAKKLNMTQVMVSRYEKRSLEKLRMYYEVK